jgi:hypothetical protein
MVFRLHFPLLHLFLSQIRDLTSIVSDDENRNKISTHRNEYTNAQINRIGIKYQRTGTNTLTLK